MRGSHKNLAHCLQGQSQEILQRKGCSRSLSSSQRTESARALFVRPENLRAQVKSAKRVDLVHVFFILKIFLPKMNRARREIQPKITKGIKIGKVFFGVVNCGGIHH